MEKIKLFVIDDHKLFVEGIISLLGDEQHFHVVGFANSGVEFLNNSLHEDVDVYLLDINMPEISGIELARKIREKQGKAGILAITMYDDFDYVEKMIKSGVTGYILKSASIQELTQAIETVARGEKFFGREIREFLFNKIGSQTSLKDNDLISSDTGKLTRRETEILILIAKEFSTRQIAEKLFISERTVETHRKNIFSKTNAKTLIGLSKYAIQHGIVAIE
jgi:DNA-binding NarL/FixJ family response regulator